MWLFNHLREYQPEFCGKIDYTSNKVLRSAEHREAASLAANGLESEGEMATVIEMSLQCMLWAAYWTVLRSWGACSEIGGDIPELNYTKMCYGGHFTFSLESVRVAVRISIPASREGCCCRCRDVFFTLLTCITLGLVLWDLQYCCWHQQSVLQDPTLHGMRWRESQLSDFPLTPPTYILTAACTRMPYVPGR